MNIINLIPVRWCK